MRTEAITAGDPGPAESGSPVDSFGARLGRLRRLIPRNLLDGPGWTRLIDRVGGLPGEAVLDACGFEFRLGEPEPAADFAVPVIRGQSLERYCIGLGRDARPDSSEASLARHLGRDGGSRSPFVTTTMLEYDIAEIEGGKRPPPGVFLKLSRASGHGLTRPEGSDGGVVADLLADAVGRTRDEDERRMVEQVFAALPAGGRVIQAGAFPGRAPRSIRLVARGIEPSQAASLLKLLRQPRPVEAMTSVLAVMGDVSPIFGLSFDVGACGVSPRIGLEMAPPAVAGRNLWLEKRREDWRPLIDRLESRGWSLPAKARGLRAWPGRDKVYEERGVFFVYRGLHHVKLVVRDDTVTAKAYAGMMYSPSVSPVPS